MTSGFLRFLSISSSFWSKFKLYFVGSSSLTFELELDSVLFCLSEVGASISFEPLKELNRLLDLADVLRPESLNSNCSSFSCHRSGSVTLVLFVCGDQSVKGSEENPEIFLLSSVEICGTSTFLAVVKSALR